MEGDERQLEMGIQLQLADIGLEHFGGEAACFQLGLQQAQHLGGEIDTGQAGAGFEQRDRDPTRAAHQLEDRTGNALDLLQVEVQVEIDLDGGIVELGDVGVVHLEIIL